MIRFCTDAAQACGEPLAGTGAMAERHLFIRWPKGKWRRPRFEAVGLNEALRSAMRQGAKLGHYVGLCDTGDGPELELISFPDGVRQLPRDQEHAAALISAWAAGSPLTGEAIGRRVILCCTDAKTDACCARYGFAVYKALSSQASAFGLDVLQVTHIGGCHFAPSVIVMPDRRRYGRLTPALVPVFLSSIAANRLYLPAYKGDPGLGEIEQVADIAARQRVDAAHDHATSSDISSVIFDGPAAATAIVSIGGVAHVVKLERKTFAICGNCRDMDGPPTPKQRWVAVSTNSSAGPTANF